MRHLFILNPAAGKTDRTAEYRAKIEQAFAGQDYTIEVSRCKGDCTAIARAAAQTGDELRIYACGGDGTLNEVVSGIVGFPNVAVTSLTAGSGNDFVRNFSEPTAFSDPSRFLDTDEAALDLVRCGDDHYSLNVCSMGFDARIGTQIDRYKRLPLVTGSGAYIISIIVNLIRGVHRPYEIEVNGETISGEQSLICICNGRWYGGGFHPVPSARLDDGVLDVLLVCGVSRLTVTQAIGKYKNGRYRERPDLIRHIRCRSIRIRCAEPEDINLDGELIFGNDVVFSVAEEKIRFFYPRGLEFFEHVSREEEEIGAI
jgi:YegS/Rv2252/BmrU family lipid kinase